MLDKLKADFDGIIELVHKTPAALQEMAFRMILEQWFHANAAPKPVLPRLAPAPPEPGPPAPSGGVPDAVKPFLTAVAAPYRLRVAKPPADFIGSLHPELRRKVRAALDVIRSGPSTGTELRNELAGLRSVRVGRFRIIYRGAPGACSS